MHAQENKSIESDCEDTYIDESVDIVDEEAENLNQDANNSSDQDDEEYEQDGEDDEDSPESQQQEQSVEDHPENIKVPVAVSKKRVFAGRRKWTSDFDSAAAFKEYMKRLDPPSQRSKTPLTVDVYKNKIPTILQRRGLRVTNDVHLDVLTNELKVEAKSYLKPAARAQTEISLARDDAQNTFLAGMDSSGSLKTLCIVMSGKICISDARAVIELVEANDVSDLIIFAPSGWTPCASTKLAEGCKINYKIFDCSDVLPDHVDQNLNSVDHKLNSTHRVLNPAERKVFLKDKMVPDPFKLPVIKMDDPYAKFYGFMPGQIIEFKYCYGGTIGMHTSYRICIQ